MTDMRQKIMDENIKLHRIEAPCYDELHPEEFNWFEQRRISSDIAFMEKRLPNNTSALDIGCGTGNILLKLLDCGYSVRGVDISKDMLDELNKHIPEVGRGRAKLYNINIDDFLSDCTDTFDLITISSVLHHLPDYLETLKVASRLLSPRGILYITHEPTKNALSPDRFLRKLLWQADSIIYKILNRHNTHDVESRDYRFSDYHLYHGFDEDSVVAECEKQGLKILKFEKYSSAMRLGISCWIDSELLKNERQFRLIAVKTDENARKDKALVEYYNYDRRSGAVFYDNNAAQYGIKDGNVVDPIRHYFFYDRLLGMVVRTINEGAILLDAGCGMGILAEGICSKVKTYVGVDISIERIKQCRKKINDSNSYFVVANVTRLPFKETSFSAAVSIEVIEHVPDTHLYLSEIYRVLKKGSLFILSTPGNIVFKNNIDLLGKEQHLYEFSPGKLRNIFSSNRLTTDSIEGVGFKSPRIIIPTWMGSDIIKYVYKKMVNGTLKAGYGSPISLEFDIMTNSLFRKIYRKAKWKKPLLMIMETLNSIGKHLPGLSSTIVAVGRK